MTTTSPDQRFRSHPLSAWAFATALCALTLAYMVSLLVQRTPLIGVSLFVPLLLITVFMAAAVWLGTRPAYSIEVDDKGKCLRIATTWPVKRIDGELPFSDITRIAVLDRDGADTSTYAVVAETRSGSVVPLSVEFSLKRNAENLAAGVRAALER